MHTIKRNSLKLQQGKSNMKLRNKNGKKFLNNFVFIFITKGEPLAPFDPEKVDVRLSDELIYKCYKWRLSQNDCLNRGYILDGYPKRYQDAK